MILSALGLASVLLFYPDPYVEENGGTALDQKSLIAVEQKTISRPREGTFTVVSASLDETTGFQKIIIYRVLPKNSSGSHFAALAPVGIHFEPNEKVNVVTVEYSSNYRSTESFSLVQKRK